MIKNKIYKDDVGTEIIVDCKTDVAPATIRQIWCRKANGTEVRWNASIIAGVSEVAIAAGGSGYAVDDALEIVQPGGSGAVLVVTKVGSGGEVQGVRIHSAGSGYLPAGGLVTTGGNGSGCLVNITNISGTLLRYVAGPGDFDQVGIYIIQSYVVMPSWRGLGESVAFEVFDKFC